MLNKKDFEILNEEDEKQGNYMALGMVFGVLFGSVGMIVLAMSGHIEWGALFAGIGLLTGMLVGMNIPKKDK